MIPKLPRKLEAAFADAASLAIATFNFASDVLEFLRALPTLELQQFNAIGGGFPVTFETETSNPVGVVAIEIYETNAPGVRAASTLAWSKSESASESGITISAMSGLTNGTEYTIRALVIGERV